MQINVLSRTAFKAFLQRSSFSDTYYQTKMGCMRGSLCSLGLFALEFVDYVPANFIIQSISTIQSIVLVGTDFQCAVWRAALQIPEGKTQTYQEIAHSIGKPKAYRAVGMALHSNQLLYLVPCHRVIGKKGDLVGFRLGIEKKRDLLQQEAMPD